MYYVIYPKCGAKVEIPDTAVGQDRTDPWNVVGCDDCHITFDDDDEEVIAEDSNE